MDYQVEWSPEALEDVDGIAEYIAKDSPFYASAVASKILDTSRELQYLPLRGRVVPELKTSDFREFFVYSYRLIYQISEKNVLIVAVIHGHRQLDMTDRV